MISREEWPYIAPPVMKNRETVRQWLEEVLKDPEIKVLKPEEDPFEDNRRAYEKGMQLFKEHQYEDAFALLKKIYSYQTLHLMVRHRHDYPDALAALGWMYEFGIGTEKKPETAISYYERAAEAGNPDGCFGICSAYLQLDAPNEDQQKAFARFVGGIPDDPDFKTYQKNLAKRKFSWEDVYIFISSTFNDMNAERDFLVKKVIPELRAQCCEHRLKLVEIDLRWGIKEEDAAENKKVVDICLNNVDRCRPFFLCFLGQRLGWVPMPQDISSDTLLHFPGLNKYLGRSAITEMEIIHALLDPMGNNQYRPKMDGFFYFRDPSYLEDLQTDEMRELYCPKNQNGEQLESLKKMIRGQFPTHTYSGTWEENDLLQGELKDFQCEGKPMKEVIIEEMMTAIRERYPEHWEENAEQDSLEKELEEQDNYLFRLNDGYLYRDGLEDAVTEAMTQNNGICILEAPSGSGKSAFLSDMILNTMNMKMVRQYYRFIGATDQSLSMEDALRSLYRQFEADRVSLINKNDLEKFDKHPQIYFPTVLRYLRENQVIIIFLDGIDQTANPEMPYWIPRDIPANVKIVLTYDTEAEQIRNYLHQEHYSVITLRDFGDEGEKRALIDSYLSQYLKALDETQINKILSMEGSSNPLFLKILLEELRIYGSFETLSDFLDKGFGDTPEDAFVQVIRRLYAECADEKEKEVVKTFLGALSLAESAVSLPDLCRAVSVVLGREADFGIIEDQILQLVRQLYPYLNLLGNRISLMY